MAAADFVTGYQHIGIPTVKIEETIKFFTDLGFAIKYETENNGRVVFMDCGEILIETYENSEQAAGVRGAINHVALAVSDLDKTLEEVKRTEYPIIEGPCFLPFWENGVRYFTVLGPNSEIVEFLQKL